MAAGALLADDDPVLEVGHGDVAHRLYDEFDRQVSAALGEWNAASGRLVALTRRAIAEGWWRAAGCVDPEHWLRSRCGLEAAHARRVAATARELGDYPTVAAQLAAGRITVDHAHAIVACVDPARERSMAAARYRHSHRTARFGLLLHPGRAGDLAELPLRAASASASCARVPSA